MLNRREFMTAAGLLTVCPRPTVAQPPERVLVNDVHSQLNPTLVDRIVAPDSLELLQRTMETARREGKQVCVAGSRHAMGGQQFATDAILVDTTRLNRLLALDPERGTVQVEAGLEWPELIQALADAQAQEPRPWGIAQKQTGADRLTIGGALAANAHGRGLSMTPIVGDVESFVLVDASGNVRTCSRQENPELFSLVIGGYGLFGILHSVTLRLVPRRKIERAVEIREIDDVMAAFEQRIADGFLYGDFQFAIDEKSEDFLRRGVFSCYRPVDPQTPIASARKTLGDEEWRNLLYLTHADKSEAFRRYAEYYLSTSGQIYWSDTHQLSTYFDDYHVELDQVLGATDRATEIITEIYVPRDALPGFMAEAREAFRETGVSVIYGTVRLIERDRDSFLAWAKERYACTIFNLHTVHTEAGLARSADMFRALIDMAIRRDGSYFLTYHRYARREQVEACYPQFSDFLALKKKYDPHEQLQSDWYRHYRSMFADRLA